VQRVGHERKEDAEGHREDAVGEQVRDEGAGDDEPAVEHRGMVASSRQEVAMQVEIKRCLI